MVVDDKNGRNDLVTVSTTSVVLSPQMQDGVRRKSIVITNTSTAGQVITIKKGYGSAIALYGLTLQPNASMVDSSISEDILCFQGTISAISDALNGQVSIQEEFF